MLSKRATSIGYGKRFAHMISTSFAPSPQAYNLPEFKGQKITFGESRDKFSRVIYIYINNNYSKHTIGLY